MSAEWFDLGLRLHAAQTATPAPRLAGSPIVTPTDPIAVRGTISNGTPTLTIATHDDEATATGSPEALAVLASHGVTITRPEPVTFVTDHRAVTLAALRAVMEGWRTGHPHPETAAHLAWTLNRADYPHAPALVDVPALCRTRYALGVTPRAERDMATWRAWLDVPDDGPSALLALLDHATTGDPLEGLAPLREDDVWTWNRASEDYTDGRDWRAPETLARAALGLRSRCDAADLYAAALLDDPLHRRAAVHSGHVTVGTASAVTGRTKELTLTSTRLDSRMRPGEMICGRVGGPDSTAYTFTGTVRESDVQHGRLVVRIVGATGHTPHGGETITVHAAPPNPHTQRRGRGSIGRLYATRRSWLATGRTPQPTRREVPLDVLVAAATGDD